MTTNARTLDELLELLGVVAAGEFTRDGRLVSHEARNDLTPEPAAMAAQF